MSSEATTIRDVGALDDLLCCPRSGEPLQRVGKKLVSASGRFCYDIDASGIPLFAKELCSAAAAIQQKHYDEIAEAYTHNLGYPHTVAYMDYLDQELIEVIASTELGTCAEPCCGNGEAFALLGDRMAAGIGIDVSTSMLHKGQELIANPRLVYVQGDATRLPLADGRFDSVVMLGGIHHVPDRQALFGEVFRILRPGGTFIWREPVSDFWPWKVLRAIVYRVSPMLDSRTERPLTWNETVPLLERVGFELDEWRTCGFIGFCLFMNSDVLFVNRLFRFVPGISTITRAFARFDRWCTRQPGMRRAGLQVIGKATKPVAAGGS